MKIKRKTKKLIKELKNMESGIFKFSDGKYIYQSLYKEIEHLNFIIDCYVLQIEELMQIILEQPTEDKENDKWLLDKLNGIKKTKELKEEGKKDE